MFKGLSVAMVTPFRSGAIDWAATERLIEHMLTGGVQGLVVSGSTGEAATCTVEERRELWKFVRERARGRAWVVAGTGTNSTADSIALTRMAEELGMDGAMVVTPFYNKPTPKGQAAHFAAVARSTRLPLLSGDDALTLPCAAVGGEGIVSVVGQAAPKQMRALSDLSRAGDPVAALAAHQSLMPLFKAAFLESNPGPIKFLLSEMGLIANELRLPLVPVEPATEKAVLEAARAVGLTLAGAAARA